MRRRFLIRSSAAAALALSGGAMAQPQFFRIGTGGLGGTYFPVGGMIATAISEASGGGVRGCGRAGAARARRCRRKRRRHARSHRARVIRHLVARSPSRCGGGLSKQRARKVRRARNVLG